MLVTFVFLWIGLFARMDFRAAGGLDISLARTPLLYSVLVVPIMTFLYFTVINLFVLAGWLYQVAVKTIISLHYPLPTKAIRELIYCDIGPFGSVSSTWKIMDLPKVELQTIQKWAMANRDATEKRTVPTLVTFAILGLFANTGFFSGILDKIIGLILPSASDIVSPFSFSRFIFLALLLIVVIVFVIVLAKLFKNLAVQNLIIETCIVVEHAAIKEEQEKIVPLPKKTFLWRCLLDILSHLAKL
jgi:hypothetical protein